MQQPSRPLSQKEHTDIPDLTFPMNTFHLHKDYALIIPPHWHDHLEWITIARGSFRVQVDSQFKDLHEGDTVFVNARQLHSAFPIEEDSELYAVVFNEALLRNSALDSTENKYIKPLLDHEIHLTTFYRAEQANQIHTEIVEMVKNYQEKKRAYEILVKSSLFAALGHAFQYETTPMHDDLKSRHQVAIQPLLKYLSQHFQEPITIEQAAQLCCVSPNYFCSLFKKATGKTLLEYVNLLRIHEAEQLLKTRQYSIEQVALRVGYTNTTYFGRIFRKYKNQTAREYRNGHTR